MKAYNLQYNPEDPTAFATHEHGLGSGVRQKEPRKANQALKDYCWLGQGRSQVALIEYYKNKSLSDPLYKPPTLELSFVATWSMRFAWVDRAKLWDAIQERKRQEQEEKFWADARRAVPMQDFAQGQKLRELADLTLAQISDFIEENEQQKGNITIINRRVDLRAVIEALKLASQLQRLATGLDQTQTGTTRNYNIDLNLLPNEYLARIAQGEDPDAVYHAYVSFVMERMKEIDASAPTLLLENGNP